MTVAASNRPAAVFSVVRVPCDRSVEPSGQQPHDAREPAGARVSRVGAHVRACSANTASSSGLSTALSETTSAGLAPNSIRLIGISSRLPVMVRGMPGTPTMASGTWRGDAPLRMAAVIFSRKRVVEFGVVGDVDEQRHPVAAVVLLHADHEAVLDLGKRFDRVVNLRAAHPHAHPVQCRVRTAMHHNRIPIGDGDPVAVTPYAWILVEVGLAVAAAVGVVPEEHRHRRHRLGEHQLTGLADDRGVLSGPRLRRRRPGR